MKAGDLVECKHNSVLFRIGDLGIILDEKIKFYTAHPHVVVLLLNGSKVKIPSIMVKVVSSA